jgi:hypothetical protein
MATQYIDLIDIARSQSFGPVRAGASLQEIALKLGPPQYWGGFMPNEPLCCYMGFGDVCICFYSKRDTPLVNHAEVSMADFRNKAAKFYRDETGNEIRIRNPFAQRFPPFDKVADLMKQNGLSFTTEFLEFVTLPDTGAVMNFGDTCHFYFDEDRNLAEIQLSAPIDKI